MKSEHTTSIVDIVEDTHETRALTHPRSHTVYTSNGPETISLSLSQPHVNSLTPALYILARIVNIFHEMRTDVINIIMLPTPRSVSFQCVHVLHDIYAQITCGWRNDVGK